MRNRLRLIAVILLFLSVKRPGHAQVIRSGNESLNIPFNTATAPGYSPQEDKYDVSFYFLDLEVTNQNTSIRGSSTMHAFTVSGEIDTFVVELSFKLTVDSVFLNNKRQSHFKQENDLVKIALSGDDKNLNEYRLKVYYHGIAGTAGFWSGISSGFASGWNQKVTYTLSEPFGAIDWFPVKQNLRDKADSVWVFITVDSTLKAGSNGLLTDVKTLPYGKVRYEWKSIYPIAYYLISFAAGDYIDYSFWAHLNETDSVLVQNYLYDSDGIMEEYKEVIGETGPLLKLFSEKFGMYPFLNEKYGHSMAPMGGGMEHQTMTTIAGFDFGIVAHELAHQWFGDYITCGTWQDIWINEGFASYAEYIALEGLRSKKEAVGWLTQAHNLAINFPYSGVYLTPDESRNIQRIFNYNLSYKKGGAIIHMLRYEINDDSLFFEIIRDYVEEFSNATAIGDDFRNIVEKHTKTDFGWFFDQWYYGKGFPLFVTSWRQVGDTLILSGSQTSSAGDGRFFRTHLDYRVNFTDGKTQDIRLLYEKPEEVFRIVVNQEVQSVQNDVNWNVLKNSVIFKFVDLTKVFTASPNPFKNQINIVFRNSNLVRDIRLSSINGQPLFSQTTSAGSLSIDLSFLKSGIYLLYITEDGNTYTEKIVKN